MSSLLKLLTESILKRVKDKFLDIRKNKHSNTETHLTESESTKTHPWRLCPIGEHWVKPHSKQLKTGVITDHDGHCRKNRSKKELYTAYELRKIAQLHFISLKNDLNAMPVPDNLDYPNGNKYDLSIAGWTKFWNETLKPERPVTPDFIKVLISTESGFEIPLDTSSKSGPARGLIQITEQTRKILKNPKGELRNHLIELTIDESREVDPNIAAGIRWLYHKRELLEQRINRNATWEEVGAEYKGIFNQVNPVAERENKKIYLSHERLKKKREEVNKKNTQK